MGNITKKSSDVQLGVSKKSIENQGSKKYSRGWTRYGRQGGRGCFLIRACRWSKLDN
ncbi:MAG: hypothetical protein HYT93_00635 [Parcubacteria group bacterium]|nr:hypothetical protein [Parcubacteria group bacterium]